MIRLGTRGSALARVQAQLAAEALARLGESVDTVLIETEGDKRAPDSAWGEGAFVGAIESALAAGEVDVAVHSAKDMPIDGDPRLRIVAYLPRADPRDALVVRDGARAHRLDQLAPGGVIGTDSPRRSGFLRARRPDIEVRPLHGNVDTRLRRLDEGAVDALVLAAAGLERLGRGSRISQRFSPDELPPAPGQGAICLQARASDDRLGALGRALDDAPTRAAVEAERALLAATGGGCRAPIGALATLADGQLQLVAGFASADGRVSHQATPAGDPAAAPELARRLAMELVSRRAAMAGGGRVLVTRPSHEFARLAARLAEQDLGAVLVPAIEIRPVQDTRQLLGALRDLARYSWIVVTSANGARAVVEVAREAGSDLRAGRWAAVGRSTAAVLREAGVERIWLPAAASSAGIADELPITPATSVLLLRGTLSDTQLPLRLRQRGAEVVEVVGYETHEAPAASRSLLEQALAPTPPTAVLLASPSAARGLLALAADDLRAQVLALPALCVGATTATEARALGYTVAGQATSPDPAALAELAAVTIAAPGAAR